MTMSNAVAIAQDISPPRQAPLVAGARVQAIVPSDFDGAWRIAQAVVRADMAPKGLETPEKAMVAIMHGMEVGLTPMAALQSIAVVNGRPSIWGDGALALVRASGAMETIRETIEGQGDAMAARCVVKRKGEPDATTGTFSVEDAKKAGLWSKSGPWTQYPKRMLQMRARAFALRDGFADVLRGLHIAEEVQDIPARAAPSLTPPPAPPANLLPPAAPVHSSVDDVPAPVEDPAMFIDNLDGLLATAGTVDDLNEIFAMEAEPAINADALSPENTEKLNALYDKHRARLGEPVETGYATLGGD